MEKQQLKGKVLFPKSLIPCSMKPIDSMKPGKKVRLSNLVYDKPSSFIMTPNRQVASPYEASVRMSSIKGKRKGKSIGLSSRRVSVGEARTNGSLTPTQATTHMPLKVHSPKAHFKEPGKSSKVRLRRYTRSPSPTLFALPPKTAKDRKERTTIFPPKSVTPDLCCMKGDSSEENIIQTPAEEEEGRLSPALAYAKILETSINSYMNISRSKLPKSQNALMTVNDIRLLAASSDSSDHPRGSEAEPEPGIACNTSKMRYTTGPDEGSYASTSPLVRRLKQMHKATFEPTVKPPKQL